MQVPGSVGRKIPLGRNRKAVDVDIGESAVCALLDNGTVKCWGTGSGVGSKYILHHIITTVSHYCIAIVMLYYIRKVACQECTARCTHDTCCASIKLISIVRLCAILDHAVHVQLEMLLSAAILCNA
jgi:hypothetical protein